MSRNLLFSLLCVSLVATGCEKKHKPNVGIVGMNTGVASEVLFVGAGQSNMERMPINTLLPGKVTAYPNLTTVNVAVGNTSLDQWKKGGELYNNMISKVQNRNTRVAYLLWYQGEWEGMNNVGADTWAQRFTQFVQDVRDDLKQPNLPVVFFQINSFNMYGPAWDEVRTQQASVHIPNVTMISSEGCEHYVDNLHYTSAGYQCLADRIIGEIDD